MDQALHYHRLELGARYLAATSADIRERTRHLGWANRYWRLGLEAELDAVALAPQEAA